ncbi:MAG: hypothetical protein K5696_02585 [Lachnospiraceae bacterium]|nr:hypothetical protein [Lachnospiraceae bacterium]
MANVNLNTNFNPIDPAATGVRRVYEAQQAQKPQRVQEEPKTNETRQREDRPGVEEASRERELDHVIAVSRDGDTVQASDKAVQELEEEENTGRVIDNPENERLRREARTNESDSKEELMRLELQRSKEIREAQIEAAKEESEERREQAMEVRSESAGEASDREPNAVLADEKETIASEGQINSFIGYSDAELERMYLQGNISKFDYDKEMESRAAKEEERKEQLTDFSLETAGNEVQRRQNEMQGEEAERAFSEQANERLEPQDRAQVLQAMQRATQPVDNDPNQVAPLANFTLS